MEYLIDFEWFIQCDYEYNLLIESNANFRDQRNTLWINKFESWTHQYVMLFVWIYQSLNIAQAR